MPNSQHQQTTTLSNGKLELVHEFPLQHIEEIRQNGLISTQKESPKIQIEDGKYWVPKEINDRSNIRSYAERLVTHILAKHRPDKYPQRNPAIWMFGQWPEESMMTRRGVVKLDTAALLKNQTLYAADFRIADKLYMNTINTIEFTNSISVHNLEKQCEKYWKSVKPINSVSNIPNTISEIYTSTQIISPKYFTQILVSDDGIEYTPLKSTTKVDY